LAIATNEALMMVRTLTAESPGVTGPEQIPHQVKTKLKHPKFHSNSHQVQIQFHIHHSANPEHYRR
jgi:hypothetical protein